MMKRILLIACMLLALVPAMGQRSDSLRVVNARWQVDSLDGMVLKRKHFAHKDCLGSNQYICVLEIPANSSRQLALSCEPVRTPTSVQAMKHKACAAINGSFFDMELHNPICYLKINGKELGVNTPQKVDSVHRKYYQYGLMLLKDGRPQMVVPDSARLWEQSLEADDIMTAGPMLVLDGRLVPQRTDKTFVSDRKESEGLSLPDFCRLLRYLGCRDALNMDGGGSTTMYVAGKPNDGIVNHPSDNRRYDCKGERGVSNCILVL